MNVCSFAFIFILLTVCRGQVKTIEEFKNNPLMMKCATESGMNPDTAPLIWKYFEVPQNDPKFNCHIKCIYMNRGAITENGKVDKAALRATHAAQSIPTKAVDEIMEKCSDFSDSDPCNLAFKMVNCVIPICKKYLKE